MIAPQKKQLNIQSSSTSWEGVEKWYSGVVGENGHYYHQKIVIPGVLKLLKLEESSAVLDLACGSGVLASHLPPNIKYRGIDISPSLITNAKTKDKNKRHEYFVSDITKKLPLKNEVFTHATIILAIQNIKEPKSAFANVAPHLVQDGKMIIIMNHPCFRIPRQSSWDIDESKKIQYRRIDRYSSSMEIPIQAQPSKGDQSITTFSFHHSLMNFSRWLNETGFIIEEIEEWYSDKVSHGKSAKMENRARLEFPLFLAIKASKKKAN